MIPLLRCAARRTSDRGASAVEYGLMVAAIAALIVSTVFTLGGFMTATFDKACSAIADSASVQAAPECPGAPAGG